MLKRRGRRRTGTADRHSTNIWRGQFLAWWNVDLSVHADRSTFEATWNRNPCSRVEQSVLTRRDGHSKPRTRAKTKSQCCYQVNTTKGSFENMSPKHKRQPTRAEEYKKTPPSRSEARRAQKRDGEAGDIDGRVHQ